MDTHTEVVRAPRVASIDVLRGLVMIFMALDHVRVFSTNAHFDPTDAESTTIAYFLTRWITHFCAPVFFFLAGVSAFLSSGRRTRSSLAMLLATRGLWLIFLELTIIRFGWRFQIDFPFRYLVVWALGVSMVLLAAVIYLPRWAVAAISILMIAGHNLLDGIQAAPLVDEHYASLHASTFDWLWSFLHDPHSPVLYPLIPWIGVMSLGYAFGPLLEGPAEARARRLTLVGGAITLGFIALRATNWYGDPAPWSSPHAVLSFLATSKYPPSLLFLMMTLGPAIALLPRLERFAATRAGAITTVFGQVPFFFYILHIYLVHGLVVLLDRDETGFDLWAVYALWATVLVVLYPLCRWFAGLKARRRDVWLSYL